MDKQSVEEIKALNLAIIGVSLCLGECGNKNEFYRVVFDNTQIKTSGKASAQDDLILEAAVDALKDAGLQSRRPSKKLKTDQTEQCFKNLFKVLEAADLTPDHVEKVNVFLTDMHSFSAMNDVYSRQFASPYPARTTIGVTALPLGALVEIEMIARRK